MFSLDACWNGAGRHYSCQRSVSAFAQTLHRESDLLLFFKCGEENHMQWIPFFFFLVFLLHVQPIFAHISYQILLLVLFTFFLWLRNITRNDSMRHCEVVVVPFLAFVASGVGWGGAGWSNAISSANFITHCSGWRLCGVVSVWSQLVIIYAKCNKYRGQSAAASHFITQAYMQH